MAIGLIVAASVAALSLDHTWEGVTQSRQYSQVVPACAPTGLIIALHGAGGDSSWECQGLSDVVNNIGVVLVCPQGRGGAWKAFSSCDECDNSGGWSDGDDSEDVSFIAGLIEHITSEHAIPEGRVIVTGFSLGVSMAYRFHCERSDLIGGTR